LTAKLRNYSELNKKRNERNKISPAAIYDAYQKVLPKRKEKLFAEATEEQETIIPADLFEGQGV